MRIAITDANVFIDLFEIGWIHHLFEIKYEIVTTLEVFNELNAFQQTSLSQWQGSGLLRVIEVTLKEHNQVNLIGDTKRLSFTDRTVLFVALRDNLMVLSGDKKVRSNAEKLGLEAHGIIWFFDKVIEYQIVSKSEAALTLKKLLQINDWLPIDECITRINKWESEI